MVYTQMQSYSLFDLVVDLGSSLGLWLGISALGIVDFIIQVTHFKSRWTVYLGQMVKNFGNKFHAKDVKNHLYQTLFSVLAQRKILS